MNLKNIILLNYKNYLIILTILTGLLLINFGKTHEREFFTNKINVYGSSDNNNGVNYYSDLTRSALNISNKFLGPYPESIYFLTFKERFDSKTIIQDASIKDERIFTYFGLAPVYLVYLPLSILFNSIPTDYLVLNLLYLIYGFVIYKLINICGNYSPENFIFFLINPFIITIFRATTIHNVSRITACILIATSIYYLLKLNNDKKYYLLPIILSGISFLTKNNFILDYLIINIVIVYILIKRKDIYFSQKILKIIAIFLTIISIQFYINNLNTGNIIDFGNKYLMTHLNYEEKKLFIFGKLKNIISTFLVQFYNYFLSPPIINDLNNFRGNFLPRNGFYFDKGTFGILWCSFHPIILYFKNKIKGNIISNLVICLVFVHLFTIFFLEKIDLVYVAEFFILIQLLLILNNIKVSKCTIIINLVLTIAFINLYGKF